jgi:hypothetical protein
VFRDIRDAKERCSAQRIASLALLNALLSFHPTRKLSADGT